MVSTTTLYMVDGELRFLFPDEIVERLQLVEGDTFLVAPHEGGVKLIPTGALAERLYRRDPDKYNGLRQMADHG
jgi:hypothetical protein